MNDPERASLNEDADNEFPPSRPPVRPAMIIGIIALIVLIVAGGIFVTTKFVGGKTNEVPTPTLVPGSNLFYVQTSPGRGNFFVDGQQLAHMPTNPTIDLPLQLSAGVHQVTWQAEPFTQHCVIIVPPVVSETRCLANDLVPVMEGPNTGLSAYLIMFSASFSDLTATQQQPLFQATQQALNALQSSDTVQSGEHYADLNAPQFTSTATTTLRATLRYQVDTSTNSTSPCTGLFLGFGGGCSVNGQDCHLFCTADQTQSPQPVKGTPGLWNVFSIVRSSWTYTTLNGQIVAQNQPDEADNLGTEYLVNLYITYAIAQPPQSNPATPIPTPPPFAHCFYRFGVLLALDHAAHTLWPNLPLADAYEQNLAQHIKV